MINLLLTIFWYIQPIQEFKIIDNPWKLEVEDVYFTSYNPEKYQTDNSPCIGSRADLCRFVTDESYRQELIGTTEYIEPIALSYDLRQKFGYFEVVLLRGEGDQRCNKKAVVLDAMPSRWYKRGDLFFMNREDNTSCKVDIYKLTNK